MNLKQLTYPSGTVITLAEAKDQCRVTSTDEDALIMDCIKAATGLIEGYTGVFLQSSTFVAYFDEAIKYEPLCIDRFPITAISSVKYLDSNGDEQTIATTDYFTSITGSPAKIRITSIPTVQDYAFDTFRVYFTAGYTNRDEIPMELIQWVKIYTAHYYQSRQPEYTGQPVTSVFYTHQMALDKYRKDNII